MEDSIEKLSEPLRYYYEELRDTFKKNTEKYFDELVEKSGIDISLNKKVALECDEIFIQKEKIRKKLIFFKGLGKISLIVAIILSILLIYFIIQKDTKKIFIYFIVSLILYILRSTLLSKKIEGLIISCEEAEEKYNLKLDECYKRMEKLNKLMDSKHTFELINRNIPFLKFDSNFNMERFQELCYEYGMNEMSDTNFSTLEAASGDILGNPFVLFKELKHSLEPHTYTGSLEIAWTEYYRDADGKKRTREERQTLYATVEKLKPEYEEIVSLIFGSDVAKNLIFSREAGHIEMLSERALNKKIKKEDKNLKKMEEKNLGKKESFIMMANTEFEILFNAFNRNNEQEFRLLFTPLAQKNMIALLKNKEYGDNFYFFKNKKINLIRAEHTEGWDLDFKMEKFQNYSYEKCKNFFIEYNTNYFNNFYFTIAPLISIPLYQQYMSKKHIYGKELQWNHNPYVAEILVNDMEDSNFIHPATKTTAILKATPLKSEGKTDLFRVTAHSYDAVKRVEYVRVKGGDGNYHNVPVEWDEYVPLVRKTIVELKELGINDRDFYNFKNLTESLKNSTYKNKILCRKKNERNTSLEKIFENI